MNICPKLEIKGTLLCSVTLENWAVGISSLEVVPFLLALSLPQEHAEMVQLLMVSESPNFIFGYSNLLSEQSESSFIFPQPNSQ